MERVRKRLFESKLSISQRVVFYIIGLFLALMLSWLFYHSLLLGGLISPVLLWLEGKIEVEIEQRKKQKWEQHFAKYLADLDSHIRLGHSLEYSTIECIRNNDVLKREQWMIEEIELNVYVAEVFEKLAKEKQVESLTQFSGILSSSLKSGSNLHDLIQNSIQQIQKRAKMEEEIQTMLTKVKYESHILTGFVPFILIYLKTLSPNFSQVMYHSLQGRLVMTLCLGIYLLAVYLCYSMAQIKI